MTISFGVKSLTGDNLLNEFAKPVAATGHGRDNLIDVATISETQSSAKRVHKELLRQATSKLLRPVKQETLDSAWSGDLRSVR